MKSKLHHVVSGPHDAAVVILAHGLATDLSMWDPVAAVLERRFRVLRYDARGHGNSPVPSDAFSLEDLAQDALDLMDDLDVESAHFVGLSMGGMVGMGLALDHPARVKRLVVCDARGDAPESYRISWDQRIANVRARGIDAIVEPTLERWLTPAFRANADAMDSMKRMVRRTSDRGYIRSAEALKQLDYARRLPELTVPALFLVGSEDSGAPPEVMQRMHAAASQSKFLKIPEAGHISAVEQPRAVAQAIANFISEDD